MAKNGYNHIIFEMKTRIKKMKKSIYRKRKSTYKFYSDGGHGWLSVGRSELVRLGIDGGISDFSYQKGDTIYLEEDSDLNKFLTAYIDYYGCRPQIVEKESVNYSKIRNYERYDALYHWINNKKGLPK
jgi:hypothetical protein